MLVLSRTRALIHLCNIEIRDAMPEYSPRWPTDDRTASAVYDTTRVVLELEGRLRAIVGVLCAV